jgi:hypothetical protein
VRHNTPEEQHAIILELLRTRKAGVGFGKGPTDRLTEEAWSRLMLEEALWWGHERVFFRVYGAGSRGHRCTLVTAVAVMTRTTGRA